MQACRETFFGIFVISKVHLTYPNDKFLHFWNLTGVVDIQTWVPNCPNFSKMSLLCKMNCIAFSRPLFELFKLVYESYVGGLVPEIYAIL